MQIRTGRHVPPSCPQGFLVTESNSATAVTHAFEQLDAVGTDPTAGTAAMKAYVELAQWERSLGIFQEGRKRGRRD